MAVDSHCRDTIKKMYVCLYVCMSVGMYETYVCRYVCNVCM